MRSTRIERRDAAAGLKPAIDAVQRAEAGPLWFAWTVPAVAQGEKRNRWNDGDIGDCVLEDDGDIRNTHGINGGTRTLVILARSEGTAITRVAFADERCTVDAGSRPVYWLSSVAPAQSVAVLAALVRGEAAADMPGRKEKGPSRAAGARPSRRPGGRARARRIHGAGAAARGPPRRRLLARRRARRLRRGDCREAGARGSRRRLPRAPDVRPDAHRRSRAGHAARPGQERPERKVRGQALFWLGQKAGDRAVSTLEKAVADDPDREVRKKAVFSLSQLPKDEGVPKLIAVARTHRDPEVRKQAMFWLGQSGDARALQFFEEVLKN